jgi:hypothetical protein
VARLIDADALKYKNLAEVNGRLTYVLTAEDIDNAPTVERKPFATVTFDKDELNRIVDERVIKPIKNGELVIKEERPHEWIPVNERLPEDMQKVLVWFEYYRYGNYNCMYQTYGFGYVCDGKWSPFINGETGWQDYRVIAWMPLPEAYKEEE